jgi:hypothetical protein
MSENRIEPVRQGENLTEILLSEAEIDPDLARIVAAWPQLPRAVRSAVLAIVRNAAGD